MRVEIIPIGLKEARLFVGLNHRHNRAAVGWKFGSAAQGPDGIIGIAMCGRPVSQELQKAEPRTLEITRVCTLGHKNLNSLLYGSCARAAEAVGYLSVITYTLQSESGASLKAAGFYLDAESPGGDWDCPSRPRPQYDLFGEPRRPSEPKYRWRRDLRPRVVTIPELVEAVA